MCDIASYHELEIYDDCILVLNSGRCKVINVFCSKMSRNTRLPTKGIFNLKNLQLN